MQFHSTQRSTRQNTQRQIRNNLSFLEKFKDRIAVVDKNGTYVRTAEMDGRNSSVSSQISRKRKKVVNTTSSDYVVQSSPDSHRGYDDHLSSVFSEEREMINHMKQFVATNRTESDFGGSNISSITSHMNRQREQNRQNSKSPVYDGPSQPLTGNNRITIKAFKGIKDQLSSASLNEENHQQRRFPHEDEEYGEYLVNRNRREKNRIEPRRLKSRPIRKKMEYSNPQSNKKSTKQSKRGRKIQSRKKNKVKNNYLRKESRNSYKDSPELYPPVNRDDQDRKRPPKKSGNDMRRNNNFDLREEEFDEEDEFDSHEDSFGDSMSEGERFDDDDDDDDDDRYGYQKQQKQQLQMNKRRNLQSGERKIQSRKREYDRDSMFDEEDDDYASDEFERSPRPAIDEQQQQYSSKPRRGRAVGGKNPRLKNQQQKRSNNRRGGGGGIKRASNNNNRQQRTVRKDPPPPRRGQRKQPQRKKKKIIKKSNSSRRRIGNNNKKRKIFHEHHNRRERRNSDRERRKSGGRRFNNNVRDRRRSDDGPPSPSKRKKKKKVDFRPYKIRDYLSLKKQDAALTKLGGLGPDLGNDELRKKRDQYRKRLEYSKNVNTMNRQKNSSFEGGDIASFEYRKTARYPTPPKRGKENSTSKRAKDFSEQIRLKNKIKKEKRKMRLVRKNAKKLEERKKKEEEGEVGDNDDDLENENIGELTEIEKLEMQNQQDTEWIMQQFNKT